MTLPVVESGPAVRDALDIAQYLAERADLDTSDRFLDSVKSAYRRLADAPGIGKAQDFGPDAPAGLRSWPVPGFRQYLVFYRVAEEYLDIVRILHGAQNLPHVFILPPPS